MKTWIVIIKTGEQLNDIHCYGPFYNESNAHRFAMFLTKEVDPAIARFLQSPTVELMNWANIP